LGITLVTFEKNKVKPELPVRITPAHPEGVSSALKKLRLKSHNINLTFLKYILVTFIRCGSHHLYVVPKQSHHTLLPQSLTATNMLSFSMYLPILGVSYK
jgi:hypothetical protein